MLGAGVGEAFWVVSKGCVEDQLSLLDDVPSHAAVQHLRGQQGDPAVMVFLVIPGKERLSKSR